MLQPVVLGAAGGGCLLLLAVILSKALLVVIKCLNARRECISSPIPGPPMPRSLLGEPNPQHKVQQQVATSHACSWTFRIFLPSAVVDDAFVLSYDRW
jgi:hypothetical protein